MIRKSERLTDAEDTLLEADLEQISEAAYVVRIYHNAITYVLDYDEATHMRLVELGHKAEKGEIALAMGSAYAVQRHHRNRHDMNHKRSYLSTSALKAFAKSPNHYIEYVNGERKATPAMELGSAIHCAILEPDEWHDRYTIVPKVDRRTKAGKEAWELFQKSSEGKTVLTDEQHRTMDMARIAVHADPLAKNLIDTAVAFEQQRKR